MKRHLTRPLILACALLGLWPIAHAQTLPPAAPTPGTVFLDLKAPAAARIADAKTALAAASPEDVELWTWRYATVRLTAVNAETWKSDVAALVQDALAKRGRLVPQQLPAHAEQIYLGAIQRQTGFGFAGPTANAGRLPFLLTLLQGLGPDDGAGLTAGVKALYGTVLCDRAVELADARKYDEALALTTSPDVLGQTGVCGRGILLTARIKASQRAADALPWAKAAFLATEFAQTPDGVFAVSRALRAADMNLTRANEFIAAQNDPAATNVLRSTALPDVLKAGPLPEPTHAVLNATLRGDHRAALALAMDSYVSATDNNSLNLAVAGVAKTLRNADCNSQRANLFVQAQKEGKTFNITELQ